MSIRDPGDHYLPADRSIQPPLSEKLRYSTGRVPSSGSTNVRLDDVPFAKKTDKNHFFTPTKAKKFLKAKLHFPRFVKKGTPSLPPSYQTDKTPYNSLHSELLEELTERFEKDYPLFEAEEIEQNPQVKKAFNQGLTKLGSTKEGIESFLSHVKHWGEKAWSSRAAAILIQGPALATFGFVQKKARRAHLEVLDTKDKIGTGLKSIKQAPKKAARLPFKAAKLLVKKGEQAVQVAQTIKENPLDSLKWTANKVGVIAFKIFKKIPWVRQAVPLSKYLYERGKPDTEEKRIRQKKYVNKINQYAKEDISKSFVFVVRTGPNHLRQLITLPKTAMNIAFFAGASFSSQATAALSIITVAGSILGIVVGSAGVVIGSLNMLYGGWQGAKLLYFKYEVQSLKKESKRLEKAASSDQIPQKEKEFLLAYARLYREEAFALTDFAKAQRREIATKLIKNSLFIAGNITLMASGTCMIVAVSGYGAAVCIPLSISLSILTTGIFLAEGGVSLSSASYGKISDRRQQRKRVVAIESGKSSFGGGVAKSRIGIATRTAMIAKVERDLSKGKNWPKRSEFRKAKKQMKNDQPVEDLRLKYNLKKPNSVNRLIINRYMGKHFHHYIKKNEKKRTKAIESYTKGISKHEQKKTKHKEKLIYAKSRLDEIDTTTKKGLKEKKSVEKKIKNLEKEAPSEVYKKGKHAFGEWARGLGEDRFFDPSTYQIPPAA